MSDVIKHVKSLEWQWAGHSAKQKDDRLTTTVMFWVPEVHPRKQPHASWRNGIRKFIGSYWRRQEKV